MIQAFGVFLGIVPTNSSHSIPDCQATDTGKAAVREVDHMDAPQRKHDLERNELLASLQVILESETP